MSIPQGFAAEHCDWNSRKSHVETPGGRWLSFLDNCGEGEVLLLLHGYTDSSRSFSLLETHLKGYRVIMPDLAENGGLAQASDFSVKSFADDIAWLISETQVKPKAIISHSLGAMIALELASHHSVPSRSLVTIAGTQRPRFSQESRLGQRITSLSDPIDRRIRFFSFGTQALAISTGFFSDT